MRRALVRPNLNQKSRRTQQYCHHNGLLPCWLQFGLCKFVKCWDWTPAYLKHSWLMSLFVKKVTTFIISRIFKDVHWLPVKWWNNFKETKNVQDSWLDENLKLATEFQSQTSNFLCNQDTFFVVQLKFIIFLQLVVIYFTGKGLTEKGVIYFTVGRELPTQPCAQKRPNPLSVTCHITGTAHLANSSR